MSLQLLVILVPVLFGMMGFGIDLGRLYLVRGELDQAAKASALAAAQKLIGTTASLDGARAAAATALDNSTNHAPKFNFGAIPVGESTGLLTSQVSDPMFFATVSAATGGDTTAVDQADGTTAREVQVNLTGEAPLLYWSLLSLGQARKTTIAARAVAGIGAPLCTACGIEPFGVAAISQDDTDNYGFTVGVRYTFHYSCTGNPAPQPLGGASQRVPFLLLMDQRVDNTGTLDESQQMYKTGAQGLVPSSTVTRACLSIGAGELVYSAAVPGSCAGRAPTQLTDVACGIYSRFDTAPPAICQQVTDLDALSGAYTPDSDPADYDDYTAYTGDTRRVITVPIVDALSPAGTMTVLAFRQFLIEPDPNGTTTNPADPNVRFQVLYIGSPVPLKQGFFGAATCTPPTTGPGKVVLHQ